MKTPNLRSHFPLGNHQGTGGCFLPVGEKKTISWILKICGWKLPPWVMAGIHRMGFLMDSYGLWIYDPKFAWSLKSHFPHQNQQNENVGINVSYRDPLKGSQMTPKQTPFCFTLQVTIRSTPKAASMKFATKVRHGLNFTCSKLQMTSVDVSLWASRWLRFQPIWKICNRLKMGIFPK